MNRFAVTAVSLCKLAAFAGIVVLGGSCATSSNEPAATPAVAAAPESTEARAERIFRYQSRLADALLDHYPLMETFADADPVLIAAEARMTDSCSPLTRAVVENLEGREPSLELKLEVMNTIDECERAAQTIDRMLNALEQALVTADSF